LAGDERYCRVVPAPEFQVAGEATVVPAREGSASKWWLALECVVLFVGLPTAHRLGWLPIPVIALLVLCAGGCWLALRLRRRVGVADLMGGRVPGTEWRRVLTIYVLALPMLVCFLWLLRPHALLSLLNRNPSLWLFIMVAYPLVSVFPQEVIYRVFFFSRYPALFGRGFWAILASAVVFSFGHITFHNWPAVGLTLLGGWLFATTYRRTCSLWLVVVEHVLYGWAVFTIGYGEFFLEGMAQLFR
jgi:membrane protease YdiL (CAAX protease family)